MKENTNFVQIKVLKRLIKPMKVLLNVVAGFSLAFILTACNLSSQIAKPENKLEINSIVAESTLEEKSGFFYPTIAYTNEYYAFHIANYELNGSNEASLKLDNANADKQLKVSFLIKKKKVEKLADLVGEYKGGEPDWAITDVKVYSPSGLVYLKESKNFRVKIVSVDKEIVTGEIEMEDKESKPNKIKGKFAVKLVAGADNTNANSNANSNK